MTDLKKENKAFYFATIFLRSLQQASVKHIIISPGSRSTPLTLAAAALPALKKHIILDERSAAFFALGIGKATNQPAALVCTSGTAVANYYPAVIEARMSGVPLLLLTADRPAKLIKAGANQAINQQHIFGEYPVFFHDVGEPMMEESDLSRLSKLASRAFHYTKSRQGPVHLNFPFSKPLEPETSFVAATLDENKDISSSPVPKKASSFRFDNNILKAFNKAEAPVIIVGQLTPKATLNAIFNLAKKLNAPVLSEQGICLPGYAIQGFEGFLRDDARKKKLAPDLILRFGRQPASKSVLQAITYWKPDQHIYISDSSNPSNIAHTNTGTVDWDGSEFETGKIIPKPNTWLKKWEKTEKDYFKKTVALFSDQPQLTDGHIYHHLAPLIPDNWFVFVSNSFPARDRSMFGRWGTQKIFTNRGASGIDGITSTAIGVNAGGNQPGVLFTGNLAFLHDTNALLNAAKLNQPMIVVVINNQGGSIFRMLPIAEHDQYFSTYFETPQQADITALSKSYGIHCKRVKNIRELKKIDLQQLAANSPSKLIVLECKTDADASMKIRKELWGES